MLLTIDLYKNYCPEIKNWRCNCGAELDVLEIENSMMEWLQLAISFMGSQDFYCSACKMIKSDYLSEICPCGGRYELESYETLFNFKKELEENFGSLYVLACDTKMMNLAVSLLFY